MGASNFVLLKMIFLQAIIVGCIGYGAGTGVASLFYYLSKNSELAFRLTWQILAITGCAVTFTCLVAALLSMLKVFFLEPAIVFKGE
jgi:putative ABC transport system permease protein